MPDSLTLAALLTVGGIAAGAAFTTAIVSLLKNVFPWVRDNVSGALMAFLITAVLFLLAGLSENASTVDSWFLVFVAWVTCATAAVGVHSAGTHTIAVVKERTSA